MPIRNISRIKIGNYPQGQFAGGYIYSFQINQGYAESINEIKIDIVYDKNTNIQLPAKNLTTSYRIEIGDIVIPSVYFIEHSKSISPSESIISCTFIDGSFILDKYYVGLTNRHYKVNETSSTYGLKVYCSNCTNQIVLTNGTVDRLAVGNSPNFLVNNLLIVGEEEFNEQACDIPDVKYSFSDLLATMAKIPNFSYENFTDINNKYKTSYIGTLREVLSNWCSDFGFSFYWDFIGNKLVAIDLRNPKDVSNVKNVINQSFSQNSNLAISNYSISESLNGTYQQDNIDYILKPKRNKERQIKEYFKINYSPITLNQFLPASTLRPNMTEIILAKYSPEARIIYTLQSLNSNTWPTKIGFFKNNITIPDYIFDSCLKNIYDSIIKKGGTYVVGTLDENRQNNTNEIYSRIADKIGRYYLNDSFIKWNPQSCDDTAKFQYNINYEPAPISTINPFADVNGQVIFPPSPFVSWIIERNPNYYQSNDNLNLDGAGPIYTNIDGEIADQIRDIDKLQGGNLGDTLRGKVIIAYRPISVSVNNNVQNPFEENFYPAEEEDNPADCNNICDKDIMDEVCKKIYRCAENLRPAYGLTSKLATQYVIANPLNGTSMSVTTPAEQPYVGYILSDGTFSWIEDSTKEMNSRTNYLADQNVLQYSINLNDITTEEPIIGEVDWGDQPQNSENLDIKQNNLQEKISLKIIGVEYGNLKSYLNPTNGLSSFNIYINDNGIFTDLSFENRPAEKPKPEVIMQKVGPQKIRVTK